MIRRHRAGLGTAALVLLLSIWPLYPLIGGVEPRFFGMPFSMFWLALLVGVVFFVFLRIFQDDREDDAALDEDYRR